MSKRARGSGPSIAYDAEFFARTSRRSARSAELVVPVLLELFAPASVLDVGCGRGEWLFAFGRCGVMDLVGIDAHAPSAGELLVPREQIVSLDVQRTFSLGRRFDLVLCLEVAEHLTPEAAGFLVESLTGHGDLVVFSAALPGQGGDGHINEQWLEYWVALFARHGYAAYDLLRPILWTQGEVAPYYRQNMVVFANRANAGLVDRLSGLRASMQEEVRSLVHPETLRHHVAMGEVSRGLRYALRALNRAVSFRLGLASKRGHPCPEYPPPPPASRPELP